MFCLRPRYLKYQPKFGKILPEIKLLYFSQETMEALQVLSKGETRREDKAYDWWSNRRMTEDRECIFYLTIAT